MLQSEMSPSIRLCVFSIKEYENIKLKIINAMDDKIYNLSHKFNMYRKKKEVSRT